MRTPDSSEGLSVHRDPVAAASLYAAGGGSITGSGGSVGGGVGRSGIGMPGGMPGGRLSGSSSGRSKGFSSGLLGGGGGRSRIGLSGIAQAPAFNRTKVLLFMCLPCISDCLSIFPNRSHDKLISDMLICVACRRRTCHMPGSFSQESAILSRAVSEAGYKRYGRPASIVTDGAIVISCLR